MFKINIPMDPKEAALIARRRAQEEERKKRIFNPKERIIGKDYKGLMSQIEEKKLREQEEKQLTDAYGKEQVRQDLLALEIQRRIDEDKANIQKSVDEFRKNFQRYEDRREFDLNDSNGLKRSFPARIHDEDPRCGPASLQKFEGEDLDYKNRISAQQAQYRIWLDTQLKEKKMSELEHKQANDKYDEYVAQMDAKVIALCIAEAKALSSLREANAQYNLILAKQVKMQQTKMPQCQIFRKEKKAAESREKKCLEKRADEEASITHINNMAHSELLTETVDGFSTSVGGPHRVSRDRFKGMSEAEIGMIREEQERQIGEKKIREEQEKREGHEWDKQKQREDLTGLLFEYELKKQRHQMRVETEMTNHELAREQALRKVYLEKILYRDTPTADYFDQFNTTTR